MPDAMHFRPAGALGSRFEILRPLGRGGSGLVYLARDAARDALCALKTLQRESTSRAALKSEFRTLATIRHPNLVTLFELFEPLESEGPPFFTMEYVKGANFQNAIWWPASALDESNESNETHGVNAPYTATHTHAGGAISLMGQSEFETGTRAAINAPIASPPVTTAIDWDALRDATTQLLEGLAHLHAQQRAHCDIKPGNVLITRTGRVVILDFGIAQILDTHDGNTATAHSIRGTLPYLAPEQALPGRPTTACDLYAAGVMLFETATGQRPFPDAPEEMLRLKAAQPATDPRAAAPGVPDWVRDVCAAVLVPDARRRASATEALGLIRPQTNAEGTTHAIHPTRPTRPVPPLATAFAGRSEELAAMEAVMRDAAAGRGSVMLVSGASGIGKSALIDRFAGSLPTDVRVVRGRCYERETLPFNAFDEFVAQLARIPARLPLPDDETRAMRRAFPALRERLRDVPSNPPGEHHDDDPYKQKRLAFSGLVRLLGNLADERPLLLIVDDIQWSDEDSDDLLRALVEASKDSRWFLLLGMRTSEATRDASQNASQHASHEALPAGDPDWFRRLHLGPLRTEDAATLAARGTLSESAATRVAIASGGHPYLIELLLTEPRERQSDAALASNPTAFLRAALLRRIEALPATERSLLELVALAQRPVPERVLDHVLSIEENHTLRSSLVAAQFVRTSYQETQELVAPYHDRLREVVVAAMTPAHVREAHGKLAAAFEALGGAATDLGFHYRESGDPRAFEHLCRAAREAHSELAFVRAGDLYRQALRRAPKTLSASDSKELWRQAAAAYANAGHPRQAAECFLEAAGVARTDEAIALKNRAAELFLIGGYVTEGLDLAKEQARATGTRLAPRWQVFSTLVLNKLLPMRGSRSPWPRVWSSRRHLASERIELLDLLAKGLLLVDIPGSAYYQQKATRLAVASGNREQRLEGYLGLALHVAGVNGSRRVEPARRLGRRAEALAAEIGTAAAKGRVMGLWMMLANDEARWRDAVDHGRESLEILSSCVDITWYRNSVQLMIVRSLNFVGGFSEMREDLAAWIRDASQRGDRHAETYLRLGARQFSLLARDEPERAAEELRNTRIVSAAGSFTLEHWLRWGAEVQTALYQGDGAQAWRLSEDTWPALTKSMLLSHRRIRAISHNLRARAALAGAMGATGATGATGAMGTSGRERTRRLETAAHAARKLQRQRENYTSGWAEGRLAEIALLEGKTDLARQHLTRALELLSPVHTRLEWTCLARLLAELDGNGQRVLAHEESLKGFGIAEPARFARTQTPTAQ